MTDEPLKAEELPGVLDSLSPEAAPSHKTKRLAEIARMADLLTDKLLEDQILGRPVSKDGIMALLEASSLLKDYGQPIPPLLSQIVQDFGEAEAPVPPSQLGFADLEDVERLARSLRPFQGPSSKGK